MFTQVIYKFVSGSYCVVDALLEFRFCIWLKCVNRLQNLFNVQKRPHK